MNSGMSQCLGGHVDICAGAKILLPVVVGDHAVIGANAVVLENVEPYMIILAFPPSRPRP